MFSTLRRPVPASPAKATGSPRAAVAGAGSTLRAYAAEYRRAMAVAAEAERCAHDLRRAAKLSERFEG